MAAGNVNTPASLWDRDRTRIGGEWPEALVVLDLRFWADPIACGRRPRPGVRELAQLWGWSKSRAHRFVAEWDERGTPVGQQRDTGGTVVGQQRDNHPADNADNTEDAGQSWDTGGTGVGHEWDTSGTALKDTRARSSLVSRLSSLVSENKDGSDEPAAGGGSRKARGAGRHESYNDLLDVWNKAVVPATGQGSHPRLSHTTGVGKKLNAALKAHGRDRIARMLRWYATADCRRAEYLRSQGYGLKTLVTAGNLDEYLSLTEGWVKRGMPTATSRQTAAASTRGANPDDDDPSRAYLRDWRPDPLPGMEGR